ncbi:small ribosomal subunit protein mS40 [Halyomorpha halys]|uniref:small ribosomal subunit protein mS40 n=1 Tax=Halyomorpha halys TaxID=286706 RepID=UPI0006D520C0|nr:28S ribosomal protein S18b, mitochondrial [Halyomorpha halys]
MFLSRFFNNSRILNQSIASGNVLSANLVTLNRQFHLSCTLKEVAEETAESETIRDASKDRTKVIPVETSIRYLKSKAYAEAYGEDPVWKLYRRNHKGSLAPRKTRKTCIRKGVISTGNPCPICRDEYLVLDAKNIQLLEQFISPFTGEILSYSKTGICQKRYNELLIAVKIAKDRGLIKFDVPFRSYDYSLYKN